jgi:hypothetical protein
MYLVHLDNIPVKDKANEVLGTPAELMLFMTLINTMYPCDFRYITADFGEFIIVKTYNEKGKIAVGYLDVSMTMTTKYEHYHLNIVHLDNDISWFHNANSPPRHYYIYYQIVNAFDDVVRKLAEKHNLTEKQVRVIMFNGMTYLLIDSELEDCNKKLIAAESYKSNCATNMVSLKSKLAELQSLTC